MNKRHELLENIKQFIDKLPSLKAYTSTKLVKDAASIGKIIVKAVTTSKMRKFLDSLRTIKYNILHQEEYNIQDVVLLTPKIAYIAGKEKEKDKKVILTQLSDIVASAISKVQDKKDLMLLVEFVEAIVAYHRFYGGKD